MLLWVSWLQQDFLNVNDHLEAHHFVCEMRMIFLQTATLFALNFLCYFISWLFSFRSSVSPSLLSEYLYPQLHSLPLVPGWFWIQRIAEHCERLSAVSLPVQLDHLCLPSAVLAGTLVQVRLSPFIPCLQCFPCSAALMLPCIAVQSLLWRCSCGVPAHRELLPILTALAAAPLSTPAAVQWILPGNRSGWKWTQQSVK